jgi:trans-aconitate methyltransferase
MTQDRSDQEWSSARYAENAHFVPALGQPVLELLDVRSFERILDLGCGDGVLTEKIADLGAMVIGVDSSAEMVAAARGRDIDARLAEGEALPFDAEFDAVFSNAAMHWMKRDPDAVILSVRRALKPGGRFVAELGGHGCVAAITVALVAALERRGVEHAAQAIPWYFPTVDGYGSRLRRAGFEVEYIELIPRPTPLPTGMRGWLDTFAIPFTRRIPEAGRSAYLDEVVEALRPVLCDEQGRWTADYMRLRFRARKL